MVIKKVGLKEAAKRGVGTGANQIPDMASFSHTVIDGYTHVFSFPNGMVLQTGKYTAPDYVGTITFPVPFPSRLLTIAGLNFNSSVGSPTVISGYGAHWKDEERAAVTIGSTLPNKAFSYIAIGV
ncbi:gp53-like domain-containing protein [Escherichia coli]